MKICVIQTAFLGDLILCSSLIESINKRYNYKTSITMIVKKGLENTFPYSFLKNNNLKIIAFDKKNKNKSLFSIISFAKILKKSNFDLTICIHRSIRSAILAFLIKANTTIGFKENPISFIFKIKTKRLGNHEIFKNHNLLVSYDNIFKNFTPSCVNPYDLLVPDNKITDIDNKYLPYILIAPGSIWNTKKFTIEGFNNICKYILNNYSSKIIFTGVKEDEFYINKIIHDINSERVINLCNKLSIEELIYYIKFSQITITNDSGPLHIAVGTKTNLICFFGPTTKSLGYFPLTKNSYIFENNQIKCRPCGTHGHKKCPLKNSPHTCMKSIDINLVYKKIDDFLSVS